MTKTELHGRAFWRKNNTKIVLIIILSIFLSYTVFLAKNLKLDIVPDELPHLAFSKHYATTWAIPEDTIETISRGWLIKHNPFLYYWINGRVINFFHAIFPTISEWRILIVLRILSVFYAIGTIIFCYLISKEIITGKWWQLLPVYLLTNTLMFVFLSGGVNYDNLTNMLCMAGILFLVRVLSKKHFLINSLLWMIFIFLATLVKFTILPLALIMLIVWIVFFWKNRSNISLDTFKSTKIIILVAILIIILIGNSLIYGVNIIKFGSILPSCSDILPENYCELSPLHQRYLELRMETKLSVPESIGLGFPNPVEYFFDDWINHMLTRSYGILGHMNYFPSHIIIFYKLLFFWIILLGARYIQKPSFLISSIFLIILFYTFILFLKNYDSELIYGFKQVALQGRYLFPVIGLIYVLVAYVLSIVKLRTLKYLTLAIILLLFFIGGPIKFITKFDLIFNGWFV